MSAQYLVLVRGATNYLTIIHDANTLKELQLSIPPGLSEFTVFGGKSVLINSSNIILITGPNDPSEMHKALGRK